MFSKSSKKKVAPHTLCGVTDVVIAIFAVITTLLSLAGVYMSHVRMEGIVIGDVHGAASLIALALNLFLLRKVCRSCCGCGC